MRTIDTRTLHDLVGSWELSGAGGQVCYDIHRSTVNCVCSYFGYGGCDTARRSLGWQGYELNYMEGFDAHN